PRPARARPARLPGAGPGWPRGCRARCRWAPPRAPGQAPSYGLCLLILVRYHVPAGGAAAADGAVSADGPVTADGAVSAGGPVGTAGSGAVSAGGPVRAVAAALDGGETPAPCPGCRNPARRGAPAVAEPGGNPPAGQ